MDENIFTEILSTQSPNQLKATFAEFIKIAKMDIENCIDRSMSADIRAGLLIIGIKFYTLPKPTESLIMSV